MIRHTIQIRPRYDEVDQMGYVYHGNYVGYCHQARTELLRLYGINDKVLEENDVMLPVISFTIDYKKPSFYDEPIFIEAMIDELPKVRFQFQFKISDKEGKTISKATSTIVFVDSKTRIPQKCPDFVQKALKATLLKV